MQVQSTESTGAHDIRVFMQTRGFVSCDAPEDIRALHNLASRLIPGPIASTTTLARAQRLTGHSLFVFPEPASPTAFIAAFPFTHAGESAIRSGDFDGLCLADEWIAPFGATTRGAYIWGLGGSDRAGAFAAMRALRIMRESFFAHIDLYARASTPAGRKLMRGFGYRPFEGRDPSVLIASAPRPSHIEAIELARAS